MSDRTKAQEEFEKEIVQKMAAEIADEIDKGTTPEALSKSSFG